ncbi:MAG: histidine kinase [Marinilabiliaceae bacterium]|nr:histidine kinase [Marinilabiliaceae bacterium]
MMTVIKSGHIAKLTLSILMVLFSCTLLNAQPNEDLGSILQLRDSIFIELQKTELDTASMDQLFLLICKKRSKFKAYYKPLLQEYIDQTLRSGYQKGVMQGLDRLGLQERFDENYDLAIQYHTQSLELAHLLKDSAQMVYNYNNLGQAYRKQDINTLAIKYFHQALALQEILGDVKGASFTLNTLGATYLVQKDYEAAKYYSNRSVRLSSKRDDKRTLSYNYGTLGEICLMQHQPDSAMYYFRAAKQLKVDLKYYKGIAVSDHLIGQAYFVGGNLPQAEKYFKLALKEHVKFNNDRYQALCNAYLGKIKLADQQYALAVDYLMKAKGIASGIHSIENLILINEALFELYQETGKWSSAVQALQETQNWKDSIMLARNARELQALEVEYQTHKKEQRIELLSAENKIKNQSIRLGAAVILILVLSIALGIYVYVTRHKQAFLQQERLKQKLLKSQMNPHFIFNALGSIQSYMYRNDAKKAARYMGNFAALTRSILKNSGADRITLEEEIATLENYLHLERMRMNNAFEFQIEKAEELETEFIEIPPMMIQPFVENAIKHGVKEMDTAGLITLRFTDEQSRLKVEVLDNGVGINQTKNELNSGHQSMATTIFNQRIKILKNNYKNLPEPLIEDVSNQSVSGTRVLLYLPVMEAMTPGVN